MKPMDLMEALGDLPEEDIAELLAYEAPPKRTAFLISKPFLAGVSIAACLLVTVGLGLGVWARQQRLESRPPQEPPTFTQTQTTTSVPSETIFSTKQTDTANSQTETISDTKQTDTAYSRTQTIVSTNQTTPESQTGTAAQTTAITVQTTAETTGSPAEEPSQETAVIVPEPEQTLAVILPDPPPVTDPEEPPVTSEAVTTAGMPSTSTATTMTLPTDPTRVDYEILPGFSVTESADAGYLEVTWLSGLPPTPAEVVVYHPASERFVLEFAGKIGSNPAYWYDILDTETGLRVRIQMEPRRIFSHVLNAGGVLTLQPVGDHPGFLYQNGQQYALFWDNGCYQCSIYASDAEQALLLPVAEAMCPDDE